VVPGAGEVQQLAVADDGQREGRDAAGGLRACRDLVHALFGGRRQGHGRPFAVGLHI
jgi:hypothetical protein